MAGFNYTPTNISAIFTTATLARLQMISFLLKTKGLMNLLGISTKSLQQHAEKVVMKTTWETASMAPVEVL